MRLGCSPTEPRVGNRGDPVGGGRVACGDGLRYVRRLVMVVAMVVLGSVVFAQQGEPDGPGPGVSDQLFPDAIEARDAFRQGVVAFHTGFFNQAVQAFQRAGTFEPDNPLILEWLGWAYYRSGFVDAALAQWSFLDDRGLSNPFLRSVAEIVTARRGRLPESTSAQGVGRFVELGHIPGILENGAVRFRRPTSARPRDDGSFYVVGFAEDTVHQMSINGVITNTLQGGIQGFSQPYDILETSEGRLFVSEFGADRITEVNSNDFVVGRIGSRGRGDGELLGPQYLAEDEEGFLYVTEWGNSRVSKFSPDGEFVLSFGGPAIGYEGLSGPSGIVIYDSRVYVSDVAQAEIDVFDTSGNYLMSLGGGLFSRPEGVSVYAENTLLVSDAGRVLLFDLTLEAIAEAFAGPPGARIMLSSIDVNGMLLAADFDRRRILQLGTVDSVYSGYFVTVDRVTSGAFPTVDVYVRVEDRWGDPIVGLTEENFYLTEQGVPIADAELVYREDLDRRARVSLVADRRSDVVPLLDDLAEAAQTLTGAALAEGDVRVVIAGERPFVESEDAAPLEAAQAIRSAGSIAEEGLDLAIRLAADEVVPLAGKKGVVLMSDGGTAPDSFAEYGLRELADYLVNNDVALYLVHTGTASPASELLFLTEVTGGGVYNLLDPAGIAGLIPHLRGRHSGRYVLQYPSSAETGFGRNFIEIAVETFLANRSGRGESGYFAPLEF